jgi:hypothetical protein
MPKYLQHNLASHPVKQDSFKERGLYRCLLHAFDGEGVVLGEEELDGSLKRLLV